MRFRLHYVPGSAAMAPHAALAEAGAGYELRLVERDEQGRSPREYLALNPLGRVPTLEDGDLVLTESAACVLHVAERFPDAHLVPPPGTRERSELYRWLMFMTNTLQPAFLHWFYPERYTVDPAGEEGIRRLAARSIAEHLERLDAELADRPWLVGEGRSGADLFLFMLVRWGRRQDPPAWDRPNLRAHFTRLLEREGVRRMMDEQGLEIPAL